MIEISIPFKDSELRASSGYSPSVQQSDLFWSIRTQGPWPRDKKAHMFVFLVVSIPNSHTQWKTTGASDSHDSHDSNGSSLLPFSEFRDGPNAVDPEAFQERDLSMIDEMCNNNQEMVHLGTLRKSVIKHGDGKSTIYRWFSHIKSAICSIV